MQVPQQGVSGRPGNISIPGGDAVKIVRCHGPHAGPDCRLGAIGLPSGNLPSGQRIDVGKTKGQIDLPSRLRCIQSGDQTKFVGMGDTKPHQLARQTPAQPAGGDQDHGDPGEPIALGQQHGRGDQAVLPNPHALALLQHEKPVGGRLVPARLGVQGHGAVQIRRRQTGPGQSINNCHRGLRNGWVCPESRRRGRSNRPPSRSCCAGKPWDSRTISRPGPC